MYRRTSGSRRLNVSTRHTGSRRQWLNVAPAVGLDRKGRSVALLEAAHGHSLLRLAATPVEPAMGIRRVELYLAGMSDAPGHPELLRQSIRPEAAVVRLLVAAHCHRHLDHGVAEDAAHSG